MHKAAGNQRFIQQSISHIKDQLSNPGPDLSNAIAVGIDSTDPAAIATKRTQLLEHFNQIEEQSKSEPSHRDVHYVSRFDGVGLFQSALSKIFIAIPNLQGYGDWNPIWVITEIEVFTHKVKELLSSVHQDGAGGKQPAWGAILSQFIHLNHFDDRAPYPQGVPDSIQLPDKCTVALVADWGGDNDAAKAVADGVRKYRPDFVVHLGDIYYGGTKWECEHFLNLWPKRIDMDNPQSDIQPSGSFALNGNHEMYSGGEYYFNTVLAAFGQKQPFFCLENAHWRIIGLDTAYNGGRLKPNSPTDAINSQWNWLIGLLKSEKKPTIFLSHHQPVSAHQEEFNDSKPLRDDVDELLSIDGIGQDAIFGWFFGHEHRCALYRDSETEFNARLIGNGCIPHEVQREKESDPGCTPVDFFNKKETAPGTNTAVSTFVILTFGGPEVLIQYIDETHTEWGNEVWRSDKGRFGGDKFFETDAVKQ